eukprot:TRINITY_DN2139_c0_g1_i1.p1 TRINITY_DN2139_c0_g1~~TRINITY_DN2139_c0_g1_i1.p1  ORF type:complete len:124 (-),score=32.98 TRINITY_DN2139_c0_g1_i1:34-405(-)
MVQVWGQEATKEDEADSNTHLLKYHQETEDLMYQQDRAISDLQPTVANIKQTALGIRGEVDSQNDLLDNTGHKMHKTKKTLKKAQKENIKLLGMRKEEKSYMKLILLLLILMCVIIGLAIKLS